MTTTALDVLGGSASAGSAATDVMTGIARVGGIKSPCAVATLSNVALSGLDEIDGYTPVAGDRILVWQQDDAVENGIYNASAGAWSRAIDCDGKGDLVRGTQVAISDGDTHGFDVFMVTSANPITVGVSSLVFMESLAFAGSYATEAEVAAAVAAGILAATPADGSVTYPKMASSALATAEEYRAKEASKLAPAAVPFEAAAYVSLTDAASITVDLDLGINFKVTIAGNRSLALPTNLQEGQCGRILVTQDATGARTLIFASGYVFVDGLAPTIDATASRKTLLGYEVLPGDLVLISMARGVRGAP